MNGYAHHALAAQLERLLADIPRLRRHLSTDEYAVFALDRIGSAVETIALTLEPTAAELVRDGLTVSDALAAVDSHAGDLRDRLCPERRVA